MCTALTFKTSDNYFGRNLDLEYSLNEQVVITPRKYAFKFRELPVLYKHYAFIGTAKIDNGYPLYYDGTNEKGLSVAGLNFPDNSHYFPVSKERYSIAPFEVIPYLLANFKTTTQVKNFLEKSVICDIQYSENYPLTPMHWLIADHEQSIVLEPTINGIEIYNNPVGVLTNNPGFSYQMLNLSNYWYLTKENPKKSFSGMPYFPYSNGMGGLGIPGDFSSVSRFVRTVFAKNMSIKDNDNITCVSQFFHVLSYAHQVKGCVVKKDKNECTVYSSCCNTSKGIYYYNTYENRAICAIDMHKENLNSSDLISFDMMKEETIIAQN